MFNALDQAALEKLSTLTTRLIVGGETPSTPSIAAVVDNGVCVTQIYGPTEATVWIVRNHYRKDGEADGSIIGDVLDHVPCIVATTSAGSHPRPLPKDSLAVGELWLSGTALARGYLRASADSTSDNFVSNVFDDGDRWYRTGDLVRRMPNGKLKYCGRLDDQVKIDGIRVDLNEICAAVKRLRGVTNAFVVPITEKGTVLLIAFITLSRPTQYSNELRDQLLASLPSYAIPSAFIELPSLPITASGKVDRTSLRVAYSRWKESTVSTMVDVPLDQVGEQILGSWQEVAPGIRQVSPSDGFLAVGGHSLALLRLATDLSRKFTVDISVQELFQNPTLSAQTELIKLKTRKYRFKRPLTDHNVITTLRDKPEGKVNVYCIHAIGGTIYPYYPMVSWFPAKANLYAISYERDYAAASLVELAKFYANAV
ncbi:Protein C41A3.1 [Aphelenchoides avenae]|nr:Protein C41A3.1 [Aphelenchus avenae]